MDDDEAASSAVPVASPSAIAPSPSSAAPVPRVTPSASPAPAFAPTGAEVSSPAQSSPALETPIVNVAPVLSTDDSVEKSIEENMNMIAQLLNKLGDMIKTLVANAQKDA